jgi:hypothetical protein
MSLGRIEKRLTAAAVAAASFAAVLAGSPTQANAAGPVTPTGKGMVGGGLLGAEVVCITIGAIGVNRGWPYFVFGAVGAAGGVVGGFFVEKATATGPAEPALYMLAGGLGLVIPTLIVSLNATHYKPPEGDRPNEPATNEPAKESPAPAVAPGGAAPKSPTSKRDHKRPSLASAPLAIPHIPLSALDIYKGKIAVGLPALEVRPLYTQRELWQYGVAQGSQVRVPLFQAMF